MKNVHTRLLHAPIELVRPWIEACWSGTDRDAFPRDVIASWRKNPQGVDPLALVPNVTRLGHGVFSFNFESWDGARWRVRVERDGYRGWHGFDLRGVPDGCEVTHAIELDLSGSARVVWPMLIAPVHDWCVEAIFDRIEEALATGTMPTITHRKMPWLTSTAFGLLRKLRSLRSSKRVGASTN
jgi:hypothetical protein